MSDNAQKFKQWLTASPTTYHAVANTEAKLQKANFIRHYSPLSCAKLAQGSKVYFLKDGLGLIAVSIGESYLLHPKLIAVHADSPALILKPNALQINKNTLQLAVEVYGGAILSSWFDRPLYLAGQVSFRDAESNVQTALVELKDWRIILPNAAIHLNPGQNEGQNLKQQQILTPLVADLPPGFSEEDAERLIPIKLATQLQISSEQILDYQLSLHPYEPAELIGLNQEWILSGRLDNLGMVDASLEAFCQAAEQGHHGINILLVSNHEEVGSLSSTGAQSLWYRDVLLSIYELSGHSLLEGRAALSSGFIISADQAHAVHPNFSEFSDTTNLPYLNKGPVIKSAAGQSYATTPRTAQLFAELCELANIPHQNFTNRTATRGGTTVGPIISSIFPSACVDVGNPLLAMHSACELGGIHDQAYAEAAFFEFYCSEVFINRLAERTKL